MNPFSYLEREHEVSSILRSFPGWRSYQNTVGWTNHLLGKHLIYTHRKNHYTPSSFPEKLHAHEHYELLIPRTGDVTLIINNHLVTPRSGSVFLFRPGTLHTARLLSESDYDRYALFFTPEAFSLSGAILFPFDALTSNSEILNVPSESEPLFYDLLAKIDQALEGNTADCALLAYSYILQLFFLISHQTESTVQTAEPIPANLLKIKQYVDANYLSIHTTAQIAEHVYYRREHISRLFKEYFNISLSNYLAALKINHSKELLQAGVSVTDACYQSGFRNMSTFINTFRRQTNLTPSDYRQSPD